METNKPQTIIIKDGRTIHRINVKNLFHVQCDSYLCTFTILNGSRYSCSKPLSFYATLLLPYHFVQISRNTLINLEHVSAIKSGNKNRKSVLMSNGDEFPIAFRRWKGLKNALDLHNIQQVD